MRVFNQLGTKGKLIGATAPLAAGGAAGATGDGGHHG